MAVFTVPVRVHHRVSTVGDDGRPVTVEEDRVVLGAYRHRMSLDTSEGAQDIAHEEFTLYLSVHGDYVPEVGDRVTLNGRVYDVLGATHPVRAFGRRGAIHHHQLRVKRSER